MVNPKNAAIASASAGQAEARAQARRDARKAAAAAKPTNGAPEELAPELKGTIFDPAHTEPGAHLHDAKVDQTFAEPVRKPKPTTNGQRRAAREALKAKVKEADAPVAKIVKTGGTPAQTAQETFDRVAASAEWAKVSPCQAATGPRKEPRACRGVGVVDRKTVNGQPIKICAAHVLAKQVETVAERQAALKAVPAKAAPVVKASARR